MPTLLSRKDKKVYYKTPLKMHAAPLNDPSNPFLSRLPCKNIDDDDDDDDPSSKLLSPNEFHFQQPDLDPIQSKQANTI